jgi:hypothetical protein
MALSEGAAEAAAACRGEGCERVAMFVMAAGGLPALAETGGCVVQHCPDPLGVGLRPLPYTAHAFGNRCEPPYTRGALELVRQLVGPAWRGLEWFSGSSTAWFLARLEHLTSIEAAAGGWVSGWVDARACVWDSVNGHDKQLRRRAWPDHCAVQRGCPVSILKIPLGMLRVRE